MQLIQFMVRSGRITQLLYLLAIAVAVLTWDTVCVANEKKTTPPRK